MTDVYTQVTRDDQSKITQFSQLNASLDDLVVEVKATQERIDELEELETELELLDEEDIVLYKTDSSFTHMTAPKALEHVQADLEELRAQHERTQGVLSDTETAMGDLKVSLYAKFGSAINLERE